MHRFLPISSEGWGRNDTLTFDVPELSVDRPNLVTLELRTTSDYPYGRLWLVVEQQWEEPEEHRRDTIAHAMADAKGNITGRGVVLLQHEIPVDTVKATEGQHGRIRVYHIMQKEFLPGLRDVGLRITTPHQEPD